MTTYRKFDRFRAHSAFATDDIHFIADAANRLITTGTGTPANAQAANGGYNLVTSAAANDSSIVQRGIESAATKIANIPLSKKRKVSAVARFEHANFTGITLNFGLLPANAAPFGLSTGAFMTLRPDGTYDIKVGALTASGQLVLPGSINPATLAQARDKFGGIDCEVYHDGDGKIGFFVGGVRIGGFDITYDAAGAPQGGLAGQLSVSAGIVSTTASAKTVLLRRIGTAHQIAGHYPQ